MPKEIIVTTQAEWDALPARFEEYTRIVIRDTKDSCISVEARGNASVEAWGNASVVAWGNASVEARGNASVVAWGNASVEAWGNASVEAWGNASVVAWGNVVVRIGSNATKAILHGFAVAFIAANLTASITKESSHAHIQIVQQLGWFERNAVEQTNTVILYKRVSSDFKTQENTSNETLWRIGTTVTIKDWTPSKRECGPGKFHACSRPYFCDEFRSAKGDRYIAVEIKKEDLHEWKDNPEYPHKIGLREGKVLYECDRFGKEIKAARKAKNS